jgi:hypothetical protein
MPMSKHMQRVYDIAVEMDKNLSAYDFPSKAVAVYHDDGTNYWFENAFAMIYYDKDHNEQGCHPGHWLMVFTEHHGIHVFHLDELERGFSVWEKGEIPKHPDFPPYQWKCELCGHEMIEPVQYKEGPVCPMCEEFRLKLSW